MQIHRKKPFYSYFLLWDPVDWKWFYIFFARACIVSSMGGDSVNLYSGLLGGETMEQ
jgi:hypothetical protein